MAELTDGWAVRWPSWAAIDSRLPLFSGAIGMAVMSLFGERAFQYMTDHGWNIANIYGAVFDLFSILTGLLFAVYGIVLTGANPFMQSLRRTNVYRRYRKHLKEGIYLGFLVTIGTLPLLVIEPKEIVTGSPLAVALSMWVGASVAGFHLFVRIARGFIAIAENPPERPPLAH